MLLTFFIQLWCNEQNYVTMNKRTYKYAHTATQFSFRTYARMSHIYIYLHVKRCDRYVDEQKWKMSGFIG